MAQSSSKFTTLGEQLTFWRQRACWSRHHLAATAGVAQSTIQEIEKNKGTLTYYLLLVNALGLQLKTPGHGNRRLGTALAFEREAQGITRRELARHLGVSRNTLAALESNCSCRLSVIDAMAAAIGVRLVVAPPRNRNIVVR